MTTLQNQILSELTKEESTALIAKLQYENSNLRIELRELRDTVITLTGAVNLDEEWIRPSELTVNILRACINRIIEAKYLLSQGLGLLK